MQLFRSLGREIACAMGRLLVPPPTTESGITIQVHLGLLFAVCRDQCPLRPKEIQIHSNADYSYSLASLSPVTWNQSFTPQPPGRCI